MKTYTAKPSEIHRDWIVLDATGVAVGRLCSEAARILRGKHKPTFTTHIDTGDHVVIINAAQAKYTGNNKGDEPMYRHTLYPGGIRSIARGEMLDTRPDELIRRTVKGMLPHNSLGAKMLGKLKVYSDGSHPHEAQIKGAQNAGMPGGGASFRYVAAAEPAAGE